MRRLKNNNNYLDTDGWDEESEQVIKVKSIKKTVNIICLLISPILFMFFIILYPIKKTHYYKMGAKRVYYIDRFDSYFSNQENPVKQDCTYCQDGRLIICYDYDNKRITNNIDKINEDILFLLLEECELKTYNLIYYYLDLEDKIPKSDLSVYIRASNSKDSGIRSLAVRYIGRINEIASIPILLNALNDDDRYVRMDSLLSLKEYIRQGLIKPNELIPVLIKCVKDDSRVVRIIALDIIGDNIIYSNDIIDLLNKIVYDDTDEYIRRSSSRALNKLLNTRMSNIPDMSSTQNAVSKKTISD